MTIKHMASHNESDAVSPVRDSTTEPDAIPARSESRANPDAESVDASKGTTTAHDEPTLDSDANAAAGRPVSTGRDVATRAGVPGRNARGRFQRGNTLALRRPVPHATFDAVRADIATAAAGCRLPDPIRAVLVDEATHLTIACQAILGSLDRGLLSNRGRPRPQLTTYLELVARLEKVADLLGLFDASPSTSGVPAAVLKKLTPAARAAMEQRGRP